MLNCGCRLVHTSPHSLLWGIVWIAWSDVLTLLFFLVPCAPDGDPIFLTMCSNVETPYGSFNSGDLAAAVVEVLAMLELPGSFARQGTPGSVSFFDLGRLLQERVYTGVPSMFFNLADVKVAPSSLQEATPGESAAVQGLSATAVPPENTVGSVAVATPSAAPSDPRLRDPRRRRLVVVSLFFFN